VKFYVEQLGFKLVFDAYNQNGVRSCAVSPPDGGVVFTLIAPDPESPDARLIGQRTHVVLVTDDVSAKFREWRKRGVRFRYTPRLRRLTYRTNSANEPAPESGPVWGGVHTRFEDIDGNSFGLVSFDEVSQTIEEQRRAAAEKLEAERRAAQELEIARQVQARLFPQSMPSLKTLEYAGVCIQARHVGGDYYDFLDLGQDRLGLIVGDIAGKGIAAALLMANLQANLRAQCAIALDHPRRLLRSVNDLFYKNTADSAYATLFFAEYDDRARRLRYINCGHLSALLLRGDQTVERLESTSTVVGLFRDWDCETTEAMLCPGDTLALYTDGITESFNRADEEFGEQRLIEALRRHRELSPNGMLRSVVENVRQFSPHEQQDDLTLIVAKCVV